jgi:hypothetical protein
MLSFKKATLTTEDETKDGVLVMLEDHDCNSLFPKTTFVPYNETVFFTKKAKDFKNVLHEFKGTMLEMMKVANLNVDYTVEEYFFYEKLGLLIAFEQPYLEEPYQPNVRWKNSPVYIKLLDPIEWLNDFQPRQHPSVWEYKNVWIKAMLNKNPPEILKNKLIAYSL